VKLAPPVAPDRMFTEAFEEMGGRAEEMIKVALDAFAARNVEQAETLVDLDELIDRANRRFVQHVLSFGRDPKLHEWGLRMILVSRCFERIGDHAVDIGERVAYMASGEFREFTDASHPVDS
jgi:phosphate transport system protein